MKYYKFNHDIPDNPKIEEIVMKCRAFWADKKHWDGYMMGQHEIMRQGFERLHGYVIPLFDLFQKFIVNYEGSICMMYAPNKTCLRKTRQFHRSAKIALAPKGW